MPSQGSSAICSQARIDRWERLLGTALFAFTPLVYGLSLTVSPDFAVLAFLCLVIWCVLREYTILAIASGVMLCFTKEAGALLYAGLVLGIFGLLVPYQAWHKPAARWRALASEVWRNLHLLLPLALYAFYIASDGQLWIFSSAQDLASTTRLFPLDPWNVWVKTIQMFLASFNWLVWGLIGVGILVGLLRRRRGAREEQDPSRSGVWFVVLGVAMIPFVLVNYIFLTWNNARYILPVCLFAAIFLPKALEGLWRRRGLRIEMLAICLVLFGVSTFRTVDPFLVRLFTTFRFGEHRMSFYNSEATVCDLSFYNHEFVYYNRLFDRFLAEAGFDPGADEFVFFTGSVWAQLANHNIEYLWTGGQMLGPLYVDPASMTRTYDATGTSRAPIDDLRPWRVRPRDPAKPRLFDRVVLDQEASGTVGLGDERLLQGCSGDSGRRGRVRPRRLRARPTRVNAWHRSRAGQAGQPSTRDRSGPSHAYVFPIPSGTSGLRSASTDGPRSIGRGRSARMGLP